jgi:ABC-2 type transport system ATP-binding protein
LSFEVAPGEFVAYAGPNGAGKSTTMKLLAGMLLPNAGELSVLGLSPRKDRIAIMRRLGVLFGNRTELWWDHPVIQSFEWKKVVWDIPEREYQETLDTVTELLGVKDLLKTFARELSLGQRMRADLAMLLLHRPELILLDEPTLGLDVMAKRRMIGFLKKLNAESGTTIIVTSHDMDDLEEMARRILLISGGKAAFDGDFSALRGKLGCVKKAVVLFESGERREVPYQDTNRFLYELSGLSGIADVSFTQTSLEEGLANLYSQNEKNV